MARIVLVATTLLIVVGVGGVLGSWFFGWGKHKDVIIATGPEGGVYHALGISLSEALANSSVTSLKVVSTEGSLQNAEMIQKGAAELAFLQDDTPLESNINTVAQIGKEYLHIVIRRGVKASQIDDLKGLAISIGLKGSGTRRVANAVLRHFGLENQVRVVQDIPQEQVFFAMENEMVDAVFILSELPSPLVNELCRKLGGKILSLGLLAEKGGNVADGIEAADPHFRSGVIPMRTYGEEPEQASETIYVINTLVASTLVGGELVRDIVRVLFEKKNLISETIPAILNMKELNENAELMYPIHPGAHEYYARETPPFVVRYSETIALAMSIFAGALSGFFALRQWMRRRSKENIDRYYDRVAGAMDGVWSMSRGQLESVIFELYELRRSAFKELVNENLDANESFTIFQDYLQSEIATIERLLHKLSSGS